MVGIIEFVIIKYINRNNVKYNAFICINKNRGETVEKKNNKSKAVCVYSLVTVASCAMF